MGRATAPSKKGAITIAGTSEQKAAWNAKTYKRYQVYLRLDEDADLIAFIEQEKKLIGTTELFREALESKKNKGC